MHKCNLKASHIPLFSLAACLNDYADMYLDDPGEGGDNDGANLGQHSHRRS